MTSVDKHKPKNENFPAAEGRKSARDQRADETVERQPETGAMPGLNGGANTPE